MALGSEGFYFFKKNSWFTNWEKMKIILEKLIELSSNNCGFAKFSFKSWKFWWIQEIFEETSWLNHFRKSFQRIFCFFLRFLSWEKTVLLLLKDIVLSQIFAPNIQCSVSKERHSSPQSFYTYTTYS